MEKLEKGNCCYINNNKNILWLIEAIKGEYLRVSHIQNRHRIIKIIPEKDITEIIEN